MKLTRFEGRWAEAVGRTLLPKGICQGALDHVDAAAYFDQELSSSAWYVALLLRLALWLTWWSPPFVLGRWHTFGGLSEAERAETLERLLTARLYELRMAVNMLKITFCGVMLGERQYLEQLNAYGLAEGPRLPEAVPPAVPGVAVRSGS
jgi:hypothetical protein